MIEILAPAGGAEQLTAAVRTGADAVYLGLKSFSARAGAENFDDEALLNAVKYCHARGVRVHVALNTLAKDSELESVAEQIEKTAAAGADAVIVQDLAVAGLVREICPSLPMHASTQMSIYNIDGAEAACKLGFSRAVLARELSLNEIKAIAKNSPIETEVFIHGALCMCVSGSCYLSSMIGGRSGNRGRCAQPCRLDFRLGKKDYALSLKDMTSISYINELAEAGVCSFKIEGRMKRPEYVACAVSAVRAAAEGREPDMEILRDVFSRSGFTSGYITGKRTAEMFGRRTAEDAQKSASALGRARELYRRERQSVPVDIELSAENGAAELVITDGENSVKVKRTVEVTSADGGNAVRSLEKLGGTPFYLNSARVNAAAIRPSELNTMRREAAEKLLELRESVKPRKINEVDIKQGEKHIPQMEYIRVRAAKAEQIPENFSGELVLPAELLLRDNTLIEKYGDGILCELPPVIFESDAKGVKRDIERLKELGIKKALAENIGAVNMALEAGFEVHGGYGLNILNSRAISEYEKIGLESVTISFELSAAAIKRLSGGVNRGYICYGYLPLMRMRACPAKTEKGCGGCSGINRLTDRKNAVFTLVCENRKHSALLNSVPLYVGDRAIVGCDFKELYFTLESGAEAKAVYERVKNGEPFSAERTTGLYFREIE